MRARMAYLVVFLILTAGLVTFSLIRGQDPGTPAPAAPPRTAAPPAAETKLTPLAQQMHRSARAGADWMVRANRPDGRFDYGYLPALKSKLEGDHYLRQAGAAYALAYAARYYGDERQAAVARQTILTLLLDTVEDGPKNSRRHTGLPSVAVNRLGAAGLLVLAINELPQPTDELLEHSEQMCRFIGDQQQADGSLCYTDNPGDPKAGGADPDGINYYPGEALHGLLRSQQHRPATWKADVARKALGYYRPWWQKNKNMAFVPWQTLACAEAFHTTGEKPFAEFAAEMNDWLLSLQYVQLDPRHPMWVGGFMGWQNGQPAATPPQIGSASYAESLAAACRTARKAGDVARHQRYGEALERCLQFTLTLQYTEANTQHFADWYRPRLVGGFHGSDQDGDLRIDYTQHAVCAMVQYLQCVSATR